MKKVPGCVAVFMAVMIAACLNPIGFDPSVKFNVNANVEGEISVVSPDAMLIVQNHTKTVDITSIEIRDPSIASIVAYTSGKPGAGFEKVFNLRPMSDSEYELVFRYRETSPKNNEAGSPPGPNSATNPGWDFGPEKRVNIALPVKGLYYLKFYRSANGSISVGLNPGSYLDTRNLQDSQDTKVDPDEAPEEGSTDSGLTEKNRHKLGLLIFKNLTQVDTGSAEFNFLKNVNGQEQSVKSFTMVPGPRALDQRSILLGPNDWKTTVSYTLNGKTYFTDPKVVTVNAAETFYAYFYKTKSGACSVSTVWPPVPNDAALDNEDPVVIKSDQGWLELINNSQKGSIVVGTKWMGQVYETHVMPGGELNKERFVMPVGKGTLQFRINGKISYGAPFVREIKSRQVTTVAYVDGFEDDDYVPPGMGLVKIINDAMHARVVGINVLDPSSKGGSIVVPNTDFVLPGPVGMGSRAKAYVAGTQAFPLVPNKQYLIQVNVSTTRGKEDVDLSIERGEILYGRIVTVRISQTELEANANHGSTITIHNESDHQVLSAYLSNPGDQTESETFTSGKFSGGKPIAKGESAFFKAVSSPSLPIVQGREYRLQLTLGMPAASGYSSYVTLTRDRLRLYDVNNDIWITQTDVNIGTGGSSAFVPVSDIIGVVNKVEVAQGFTLSAVVTPPDATNQNITWSVVDRGSTNAQVNGAVLTALSAGRIKVKAVIPGGKANHADPAIADFVKEFEIEAVNTKPPFIEVTDIKNVPSTAQMDVSKNLTGTVVPANATNKLIEWSVKSGPAKVNSDGKDFVASQQSGASYKVVVTARIKNGSGPASGATGDFVKDFTLTVSPLPGIPIRLTRTISGLPIQSVSIFSTNYSRGSVDTAIGKTDLSFTGGKSNPGVPERKNPFPVPPQESRHFMDITSGLPVTKDETYDFTLPYGRYLIMMKDSKGNHTGYTATTWFLLHTGFKMDGSNPIVIKLNPEGDTIRF